jgi:serine/threonine-protein kinase
MLHPVSPEIERRALALFERLAERPENVRLRRRLLKNEPGEVLERLKALEASIARAKGAIPTLIPGSADCGNALPPPERVGAFRLIERIGQGGMGDVWSGVRDDGLYDQKVAIKLIQRHALVRAAAAFDDERRFLARLEHPNIARLIDGGVTEDGLPWLVMEFFEGTPIDVACIDRCDEERVAMFIRAADAVQYAHSRMIAHADLKPPNIIVDGTGRVKLLDFGVAGLIGDAAQGQSGPGPLTRAFASPERIAGGGPSVGDDVFALGRTFTLVLAGSTDAELLAIAALACDPDEAKRYGSVAALIADLDRWRAQLPVSAMPDSWRYRADKFVGRHRSGVLATGVALILLSATSLVATSSYVRAERERGEAAARFEDARGSARYVSTDLLNRLAAKPGTLVLRSEVAQVAQHYLDRLALSPSAPQSMRLEAAEGLLRLAAAQGRPGEPNLDQPEAAKANLAKAWQLLRALNDVKAQRLKVQIRLDQARLVAITDNNIDAALTYLDEVRTILDRDKAAPALLRAHYFDELASALNWKGEYAAAIKAGQMAVAVLPPDKARDTLLVKASAEDLVAEAIFYSQSGVAAIAPYRKAMEMLERAASLFPRDQVVARKLARARWALATTLIENGGAPEALTLIQQASASIISIVDADPADEDARRMLRITENARGQALAANGRVEEGISLFAANVAERRVLWEARPSEVMRLRDYMIAAKALGDMQAENGQRAQGCRTYKQARALLERLEGRKRLTGQDAGDTLIDLNRRQRKFCATSGQI